MKNLQAYSDPDKNDNESAKRMLRRLRILLILWVIFFVVSVIWFSLASDA